MKILKQNRFLNIKGALLDQRQLEIYLEKIASEHNLQKNSNKDTYPVERLDENFKYINKTYDLLNLNLKERISIHPAGEWLVDNYYIIEEIYKTIKKELNLKKYTNFVGIQNGIYQGFARIYVLASEIVGYTEGKIEARNLKSLLEAYQNKKTLNMEEIWNINIFFYIALIEKIREICEKIYCSQIEKYKVENMIERLVEQVDQTEQKFKEKIDGPQIKQYSIKETFIEYLSYRLKLYGKKGLPYLKILEEEVAKTGTTISEVIKKEHFNIALCKVQIGNCIKSMKDIQRINFTEIFEEINGVEEILRKDPANVYENMDHRTKDNYRNVIKQLSKKTKISEIYITTKALELAQSNQNNDNIKKSHIGYYLIAEGKKELEKELGIKDKKQVNKKNIYIASILFFTTFITFITSLYLLKITANIWYALAFLVLAYIPISEIVIKVQHYLLTKIVKPKLIPKLYFREDIPERYTTMVVIPTILESQQKVKQMFHNLEVFYLANKSKNLYFTLLGDCTSSSKQEEKFDKEIIETGKKIIEKLNQKYPDSRFAKFQFIYRQRIWNANENCYLGWERKRGILTQLNEFLLGKNNTDFLYNSMENMKVPKIKYIITLDADTNLILDSAKSLIGAMAHILNTPTINKKKNIVEEGYGIIQPRIGIDIESTNQSLFTKIFAGNGGIDFYSNAISDVYQDNFKEAIFTGKGIYDLEVFYTVLKDAIPENTVLSHDLLEGLYLKCGLATDIFLFDSYPTSYSSYMTRQCRWIRGDWQIIQWLKKKIKNKNAHKIYNPLGELDKFKIIDNLRRSLLEITQIGLIVFLIMINMISKVKIRSFLALVLMSILIDFIIEMMNYIIYKEEGIYKQGSFSNRFGFVKAAVLRAIVNFVSIPYKAYCYGKAVIKTLYRVAKTKNHLLEWMTAEEAEKASKGTFVSYIKQMWFAVMIAILILALSIYMKNIIISIIAILWVISPLIAYWISKKIKKEDKKQKISKEEIEYVQEVARRTWKFFEEYLTPENNYLPPDNYQESRRPKIVSRTSSTNIGLALISVISGYDLGFISLEKCLELLDKMMITIQKLPKWNGHLYNWYNIKDLTPLRPAYISTVDSGNFVGYIYITKAFLENTLENLEEKNKEKLQSQIEYLENLIKSTDFSQLYDKQVGLMSIGFNLDENKLTPSYYDLLASEARQASLIAIAKKDVPTKHWNNLSRTLTLMNGKKGLISWSGTAFEYLMPNIAIKRYEGSLLDESCKFMIMSQKKYCNQLGIPWGISESAFNLKDLNSNYQYKAFGIPWLGLKRGLADEAVVSSYGSMMAITDEPEDVIKNMKRLEKSGMYQKYGFYEAIDYTPDRLMKDKKYEVVKTYMAHHQALILLSINNFLNDNILQKRFFNNPELQAIDILLQEKMPENVIITKEKKETVEKIKYNGYENYVVRTISKIDDRINELNVIANNHYTVCFHQNGSGYSKYKDILINRYKQTEHTMQGIQIYFKNLDTHKIWSSYITKDEYEATNYKIEFTPDMNKIVKKEGSIETSIKNIIAPNENVEIRNIKIKNTGNSTQIIEVSSLLEPVLSNANQDYAHKAFNTLFLKYEKIEDALLVKRNKRGNTPEINMAVGLFSQKNNVGNLEYEIDKEKLYGRLNTSIPKKIENSEKFTNEIGLVTDPIVAFKRTVKVGAGETVELNFIMSVCEEKLEAVHKLNQYKSFENVKKAFEISKIRTQEEARYLRIKGKDMILYQKLLSYILSFNPTKKVLLDKLPKKTYGQEDLWKYGISGDVPIILVKVKEENDIYTVKEILKAYEYFITKNVEVDLVILDAESNVYEKYIKNEIERQIYTLGLNYLLNHRIFILDENEIEDVHLLIFKSNIVLDCHQGNLENMLDEIQEEYLLKNKKNTCSHKLKEEKEFEKISIDNMDLKYKNSYGGFSNDGREYIISVDNNIPSVWSNVLTNGKMGSIVTQNLGGYTWNKNSRLNRITRWSNDTLIDTPSESIYIQNNTDSKYWRLGEGNLLATFGFGYAKYEQKTKQIEQELTIYIPNQDDVKINLLKIKNTSNQTKKLNLIYKVDLVLGEDELKTNGYIDLKYNEENNIIIAKSLYKQDINEICYIYSNEKIKSYTGNRDCICIQDDNNLNNENSLGNNTCIAIEIEVDLEEYEEKEIVLALGVTNEEENIETKYKNINTCKEELQNTKNDWSRLLEKIRVKTPVESFNIMMNGWAMYQTIASRILARSRISTIWRSIWF